MVIPLTVRVLWAADMNGNDATLKGRGRTLGHAVREPELVGEAELIVAAMTDFGPSHRAVLEALEVVPDGEAWLHDKIVERVAHPAPSSAWPCRRWWRAACSTSTPATVAESPTASANWAGRFWTCCAKSSGTRSSYGGVGSELGRDEQVYGFSGRSCLRTRLAVMLDVAHRWRSDPATLVRRRRC